MKILSAAQMRLADERTIAAGIPGLVLMENAAHGCLRLLQHHLPQLAQQRIVVLCGKGNNGGDGLALARLLHVLVRPQSLQVALTHSADALRGDAAVNLQMLSAAGGPAPVFRLEDLHQPARTTLVIDALLGTGLSGPATGPAATWILAARQFFPAARFFNVDLPSGMDSDSGRSQGPVMPSDWTATFTAPKPAHCLPPNADAVGRWSVVPIGTPDLILDAVGATLEENLPALWPQLFAPRPRAAHKGTFGHVLVIAGEAGKYGAAALAGWAALRMGAGLVTVATAAPALPHPELMTEPLSSDWLQLAEGKSAVAIGPGLGLSPVMQQRIQEFLRHCPLPVVVDADACNALAALGDGLAAFPMAGPRLLTPHPGEMGRLLNRPVADRLADAAFLANRLRVNVLLKGQATVLAAPQQLVRINPTGCPAMATAGSGDVLTGLSVALAGQWPLHHAPLFDAASAACYLHGLAGELAAASLTEACVTASSLLDFLPSALRQTLAQTASGAPFLSGRPAAATDPATDTATATQDRPA